MAGTNAAAAPSAIDGPAVILVEPQLGENIGAACRAMWNFGLTDLRLVRPRDGWPNPAAVAMASGATRVLDAARIFDSAAAASAGLSMVYATTARSRELTKPVLAPEQACADMARRMAVGERVGVLFGRERTGLENADVIAANAIVSVPVNPAFGSLNLAQCVLLIGYEWRRRWTDAPPSQVEPSDEGAAPATREVVDRLYAHLEQDLDAANYFWPEHKRAAMAASLRNLLSRTPLTDQDARMMHGVIRALAEKPRKRG